MASEVHEGQILAGKFRIERVLGQGGMGIVVAAIHLQLDERVALKFLLPEALHSPEAVERFAREARAAVKIKSEHVARVSDVGTLESGSPYMVMEYLHGEDLAGYVRRNGATPIAEAVEFLLQACEAIAEAHALGIVHRDLKPANLFVTRRVDGSPCIKVLDFGISKLTIPGASPELGMTKTHSIMGSPLYMSPEQMSSTRNVDARTDIWALGVILYETLTGRVPFDAETMPQLCGMILQDPPRPLRDLRADISESLQAVVFRCLEKNREHRYANVAELAFALAPFAGAAAQRSAERIARVLGVAPTASAAQAAALAAPIAAAASVRAGSSTNTNFGASNEPKKSRAPLLIALVAGAAAVLGGLGWFATHGHAATDTAAEPSSSKPTLAVASEPAPPAPAPPATQAPAVVPAPTAVAASVTPPSGVSPSAASPSAAPPSSKPAVAAAHLKPKLAPAKPKSVAPQPAAPAIDPLDGRR
ncbi:MAG: serine/threonine-protein kinase [Polyangiaceae bacterium]